MSSLEIPIPLHNISIIIIIIIYYWSISISSGGGNRRSNPCNLFHHRRLLWLLLLDQPHACRCCHELWGGGRAYDCGQNHFTSLPFIVIFIMIIIHRHMHPDHADHQNHQQQLKQTFALGKPAVGTLNPQERLFVVIIIPTFAIIIIGSQWE